MVRWRAQQAENEELGVETIERFSGFSPIVAELLDGARHRSPDILFAREVTLDLGGVHVTVTGVGPNHTRGDTVFFVEEDRVLFTGDVVGKDRSGDTCATGSVEGLTALGIQGFRLGRLCWVSDTWRRKFC